MLIKYIKCSLVLMSVSTMAFSQRFDSDKKSPQIGFSGNLVDFSTSPIPKSGKLNPGFSVMYWSGITKKVDFSLRYNGLFSDFVKPAAVNNNSYISEFEGALHARPMNDNHIINPFLSAGLGIGKYGSNWVPYAPLGLGLQFKLANEGYAFIQSNYRKPFSETNLDNNMFYSLGFTGRISKPKPMAPPPPPPPPVIEAPKDRDGDGVVDSLDKCPDVAGIASLQGCPDKDGDGITDADDKCPDVAGLAKYQGCPIPDTDGDGINDEEDKCVTEKGTARYQGCPIPDTDKDGVNDEEDKCPNEAGPATNFGCPVIAQAVVDKINYAAKNIFFATGSAKLLPKSFKSLNEVAKIMAADNSLKLDIDGHTDNSGNPEKNQTLSDARAAAVKAYLSKGGVDESRMTATGHGQDMPAVDNKTAAGRAKNRRVELKARNY
jgi:OmpA-OmpF porin, OOP family